jgi:hypothetical protein
MHIEIYFEWLDVGGVVLEAAQLRFPVVGYVPGVYALDLGDKRMYVGEADQLQRRFQQYRTPGGSPDTLRPNTNRRVNRAIASRLSVGEVGVSVCKTADIIHLGRRSALDLRSKTSRLLVESAAVTAARLDGFVLENLAYEPISPRGERVQMTETSMGSVSDIQRRASEAASLVEE